MIRNKLFFGLLFGLVNFVSSLSWAANEKAPAGKAKQLAASITINNDSPYTTSFLVTVSIKANGSSPRFVYLTQTPGCEEGGHWHPFSPEIKVHLRKKNALNAVYAMVSESQDPKLNDAGEKRVCSVATITHDDQAPKLSVTFPQHHYAVNAVTAHGLIIKGKCSEENQTVVISGDVSGSATCNNGHWSLLVNPSDLKDGRFRFAADHRDLAGNAATTITRTLEKETVAAAGGTLSINEGAAYTRALAVQLSISAQDVKQMFVTQDASCTTGGVWETYQTTKSWSLANANASNSVFVKFRRGVNNESPCAQATIIHDNIAPSLSVTSPQNDSTINQSNKEGLRIHGACSEEGGVVVVTGSFSTQAVCTAGAWTVAVDPSAAPDGNLRFFADLRDNARNPATTVIVNLFKDSNPPLAPFLAINGGEKFTSSLDALLSITTKDSDQMLVGSEPGCMTTRAWEPVSSTRKWTLISPNARNVVFLKVRDKAGNESSCVSASITHDNLIPSLAIGAPKNLEFINSKNSSAFQLSGTCSENDRPVVISGAVAAKTPCLSGAWNAVIDFGEIVEGAVTLQVNHSDDADNQAPTASLNLIKDTTPPTATSLAIADGSEYTKTLDINLLLSQNGGDEQYVTQEKTCTSGGLWEKVVAEKSWTLASPNQINSIYYKVRDRAGNDSTCIETKVNHDDQAPILAISDPKPESYVNGFNAAQVSISGTCSENDQAISLKGAYTGTTMCAAGAWVVRLDLSSLEDGDVSLQFEQRDLAGNSGTKTLILKKDTLAPSNIQVRINGKTDSDGVLYTNLAAVQLAFAATGAAEMSISDKVACENESAWEPFASTKPWTLTALNQSAQVFAKFRDAAGNESACFNAQILHDNVAPQFTVDTPAIGSGSNTETLITSANRSAFFVSGTCSEAQSVKISGAMMASSMCNEGGWNSTLDLSSLAEGKHTLRFEYEDGHGNFASAIERTLVRDTTPPVWIGGPRHMSSFNSLVSSPSIAYDETAVDVGSGIHKYEIAIGRGRADAQVNDVKDWTDVSGGLLTLNNLSLSPSTRYYVNMRVTDRAGNETRLSSPGWMLDTTPPLLIVSSPAVGERVSEVDVRISGACEGQSPIQVTYGPGVTGPANFNCAGNAFNLFVETSNVPGSRTLTLSESDPATNVTTRTVDFVYSKKFEIKGRVLAMAKASDGGTLYGGEFTSLTNSHEGSAIRVKSDGSKDATFSLRAGFNGPVSAVVELPDGSLVFGGSFTRFRGRTANYIAKLDHSGALDLNFSPQIGVNGAGSAVYALAATSDAIYVGGNFTSMKGKLANRLVKLDFNGNIDPVFDVSVAANSAVRALVIAGGGLFVGGEFTAYRGAGVGYLTKVNLSTGAIDPDFVIGSGFNARVLALTHFNGAVFAGGMFTSVNASAARAIAKLDANSGSLDTGFNPSAGANGFTSVGATVYGLAMDGQDLIVAGKFSAYRGQVCNSIARISATGTLDTVFNPGSGANGFNDLALAVVAVNGSIYVGGQFTFYRNAPAYHLAKISSSGELDLTFNPPSGVEGTGADGIVTSLLATSDGIYVGGAFSAYRSSHYASNLVKTDAAGNIDFVFNSQTQMGFNGPVRALAVNGPDIFVGGDFTSYRGINVNRIAKLDLSGNLVSPFNAATGTNDVVRALQVKDDALYIGGDFTLYRGKAANRIAKVDAASGELDLVFNPATGINGTGGPVHALVLAGNDLFVAGNFINYRLATAVRLAKVDAVSGLLDKTFVTNSANLGANATINSIVVVGSYIYAGGAFTTYAGSAANGIAKIAVSGLLESSFGASGFNGAINSVTSDGVSLYLAGVVTSYRGSPIGRVAKIDLGSGALDNAFCSGGSSSGVGGINPLRQGFALSADYVGYEGSNLIVSGGFTSFRGKTALYNAFVDAAGAQLP